eukprot:TRINITY_DN23072_c0_g1_i1.p2 TRINITY_DN23072_c0_g1~~TRINITY_DN23072_c0_g1_i1.p2  ORF type:complete len:212 (-),score=79.36 TRINITY_DN23072_c0_g1_i1:42-677(-)
MCIRDRHRVKSLTKKEMAQETLKSKEAANELRVENVKLRTRVKQLDAEIDKKMRVIQALKAKIKGPGSAAAYAMETTAIMSQKKYLKELVEKVKEKTKTCNNMLAMLEGGTKETAEKQIEFLTEKCKDIKSSIENVRRNSAISKEELKELKGMQEKQKEQSDQLTGLNKENQQIAIIIKRREAEIEELKENIYLLEPVSYTHLTLPTICSV